MAEITPDTRRRPSSMHIELADISNNNSSNSIPVQREDSSYIRSVVSTSQPEHSQIQRFNTIAVNRSEVEEEKEPELPEKATGLEGSVKVRDIYHALRFINKQMEYKKLLIYLVFFSIYLACVMLLFRVELIYSQTTYLEDLFLDEEFDPDFGGPQFKKNFYDIFSFDEYYQWVNGPLVNGIFNDEIYNVNRNKTEKTRFILPGGNRIVSPVRFRTARISKNAPTCQKVTSNVLPSQWLDETIDCYSYFRIPNQQSGPWEEMGIKDDKHFNSSVRGIEGYGSEGGYGHDGYEYLLPLHKNDENHTPYTAEVAREMIKRDLIDNNWVDEATRLLVVDFNVINHNLGNGVTVRFVYEIAAGGGFHGYYRIYQVLLQADSEDSTQAFDASKIQVPTQVSLRRGLEFVFLFFVIYYMIDMFITLRRKKRWCDFIFSSLWSVLDIVNIILSFVVILLIFLAEYVFFDDDFARQFTGKDFPNTFFDDAFEKSRFLSYISYVASLNIAIGFLKIFKFLRFNRLMTIMWDALADAFPEIFALFVAYIILTCAFAFTGYLLFGSWTAEFHSVISSISTVLRSITGDFDYVVIRDAEPKIAPIYYALFVFLEFFVLLNMFIAVVSEYYNLAKEKILQRKKDRSYETRLIVQTRLKAFFRRFATCIASTYYEMGKDKAGHSTKNSKPHPKTKGEKSAGKIYMHFQKYPKNWFFKVDDCRPTKFQERKRDDEKYSRTAKRKMWKWVLYKVCMEINDRKKHKRLQIEASLEEMGLSGYRKRAAREKYNQELQDTRERCEKLFGVETFFLRNWGAVLTERDVKSKIRTYKSKVKLDKDRVIVYDILLRGVQRQASVNQVDLFSLFEECWSRMSAKARDGSLNCDELKVLLGIPEGNKREQVATRSGGCCNALDLSICTCVDLEHGNENNDVPTLLAAMKNIQDHRNEESRISDKSGTDQGVKVKLAQINQQLTSLSSHVTDMHDTMLSLNLLTHRNNVQETR